LSAEVTQNFGYTLDTITCIHLTFLVLKVGPYNAKHFVHFTNTKQKKGRKKLRQSLDVMLTKFEISSCTSGGRDSSKLSLPQ